MSFLFGLVPIVKLMNFPSKGKIRRDMNCIDLLMIIGSLVLAISLAGARFSIQL